MRADPDGSAEQVDGPAAPDGAPPIGAPGAGPGDAVRVSLLLGVLFGLTGSGSSAAAVAVPALGAELELAPATTAWVLSGYVLVLAAATPVYGRLADLVGMRTPLAVGLALMSAGAVLAALAPTFGVLMAGRLLQGAGAGATTVLATALITARYQGAVRAAALGRVAGGAGVLGALGPLAGGALEAAGSWRLALALPALGLLVLPALWRITPTRGSGAALDLPGAALVTASATGLVLLLQSFSAGPVVAAVGGALLAVGVPLTARHVRRRPEGFLPRVVVTSPVVVVSALAGAAVPAAWFSSLVAVPAVLAAQGWTPLATGLLLLPSVLASITAARVVGPLLGRVGPPRTLATGCALAATALAISAAGAATSSPVLLAAGVAVVSVAFGLGQPALVGSVGSAVPVPQRGVAIGAATLVFLLGGAVGSATVGGLGDVIGVPACLLLLAALALAGGGGALWLARQPPAAAPSGERAASPAAQERQDPATAA